MSKTAWITGITGQDGSYLAEFLLSKGYRVHGLVRRASADNMQRIQHLLGADDDPEKVRVHHGDLGDAGALRRAIDAIEPDEIYNLAAQSHVRVSFDQPEYTTDVNALGVVRMLEAVRDHHQRTGRSVRFYQAGSSEMFGAALPRQHELTRFEPCSPYACAKVFAHYQVINHRESYGLFASNGILFNHESPRRGETFVTRKITRAAARIKLGLQQELALGRLDVVRDWGFAGDYVEAMWRMLQHTEPDDFVVATGVATSLVDFLTLVFEPLELDWRRHVVLDQQHLRPADVRYMQGDASKARAILGWEPKTDLKSLVAMMVEADLALARRELAQRAGPPRSARALERR